ncbi:energy transducer TonB [uncultured Desulfosarcina sp.]|uniref:energy transducer TonB n=1 Tax=uncultured Desulfosarcina sp. TaxID=218289 RepID=UPI0029C76FDB|nr:energy transducer TonB [uncultured Desulfosarcina sp.]
MAQQTLNNNYFDDLSRRKWTTWLGAGMVAAGLNIVLFMLMPYLVDPAPSRLSIDTFVPQVNVIRMQRPDTEVRRKPPTPQKPPEPQKIRKPDAASRQPMREKLTLPFEINPRLPGGPHSLVLPPLKSAPLANTNVLQGAFSVGQLDGPLTSLTRIPPVYPVQARRRGIEGWVKVAFIVDETGRVENIFILESEPQGLFDRSVERCVRGWRFKPGTVAGMPVKAKVETVIRFELE